MYETRFGAGLRECQMQSPLFSKDSAHSVEGPWSDQLRSSLATEFGASDYISVGGGCFTRLRPAFVASMIEVANDPEIDLASWLKTIPSPITLQYTHRVHLLFMDNNVGVSRYNYRGF